MTKACYHGEVFILSIKELPKGLKKVDTKNTDYVIVGLSEVTGNDHRVKRNKDMQWYEDENGTLYLVCNEPAEVSCVMKERHDTRTIPAGTYSFGKSKEFDPLTQVVRDVAD